MTALEFDPTLDLRHRKTASARECADWLAFLAVEGKSPRTTDSYERTVAELLRLFPRKAIGEFTEGDVLQVLKRAPAPSRRVRRAHFASFFGWAYRSGIIERNPVDRLPKIRRTPRRVVPTFSDSEIELLTALPSPDGALFAILFYAGLRKGEARRLRVAHVNFDHPSLVVFRGKGDKDRVVPMAPQLANALGDVEVLEGLDRDSFYWYTTPGGYRRSHRKMVGEGSFHRWYDRCLELAGIDKQNRNPHATRHTFALRWLRRGGRLETLQQMLGHESIKTTLDEYGHLDETDLRLDLELVEAR
jgi:integrase